MARIRLQDLTTAPAAAAAAPTGITSLGTNRNVADPLPTAGAFASALEDLAAQRADAARAKSEQLIRENEDIQKKIEQLAEQAESGENEEEIRRLKAQLSERLIEQGVISRSEAPQFRMAVDAAAGRAMVDDAQARVKERLATNEHLGGLDDNGVYQPGESFDAIFNAEFTKINSAPFLASNPQVGDVMGAEALRAREALRRRYEQDVERHQVQLVGQDFEAQVASSLQTYEEAIAAGDVEAGQEMASDLAAIDDESRFSLIPDRPDRLRRAFTNQLLTTAVDDPDRALSLGSAILDVRLNGVRVGDDPRFGPAIQQTLDRIEADAQSRTILKQARRDAAVAQAVSEREGRILEYLRESRGLSPEIRHRRAEELVLTSVADLEPDLRGAAYFGLLDTITSATGIRSTSEAVRQGILRIAARDPDRALGMLQAQAEALDGDVYLELRTKVSEMRSNRIRWADQAPVFAQEMTQFDSVLEDLHDEVLPPDLLRGLVANAEERYDSTVAASLLQDPAAVDQDQHAQRVREARRTTRQDIQQARQEYETRLQTAKNEAFQLTSPEELEKRWTGRLPSSDIQDLVRIRMQQEQTLVSRANNATQAFIPQMLNAARESRLPSSVAFATALAESRTMVDEALSAAHEAGSPAAAERAIVDSTNQRFARFIEKLDPDTTRTGLEQFTGDDPSTADPEFLQRASIHSDTARKVAESIAADESPDVTTYPGFTVLESDPGLAKHAAPTVAAVELEDGGFTEVEIHSVQEILKGNFVPGIERIPFFGPSDDEIRDRLAIHAAWVSRRRSGNPSEQLVKSLAPAGIPIEAVLEGRLEINRDLAEEWANDLGNRAFPKGQTFVTAFQPRGEIRRQVRESLMEGVPDSIKIRVEDIRPLANGIQFFRNAQHLREWTDNEEKRQELFKFLDRVDIRNPEDPVADEQLKRGWIRRQISIINANR